MKYLYIYVNICINKKGLTKLNIFRKFNIINMSLEKKYQKLTDLEHTLKRPGMYIGSVKLNTSTKYILEDNKMIFKEISYIPGFIKLFDEIISNSVDESKREGSSLNTIKVNIEDNKITIWDNGGIPVQKHAEYNEWIPEMIFSNMKAGANFNDDEERTGAGTNGVGSTIVNIYSKEFSISTCDGTNVFRQVFSDNMRERSNPSIRKNSKNHTEISYLPDYERFNMTELDNEHFLLIKKRVYDIAGTNPKLKIYFNDELISIKSFKDYVMLYTDDVCYESNNSWSLAVGKSDGSFNQVSFVNTVETYDGGTHMDYITNQIVIKLREFFLKKHKVDIKPSEIKNHLFIFLDSVVVNPIFSAQTKEKLVSEVKDFGFTYQVSDKLIKEIIKSDIIESILDWIDKKRMADESKLARELNKAATKVKVKKLIDARSKNERHLCSLAIFEGDSAAGAFSDNAEPEYQGAFSIRGKFTNVLDISMSNLIKNDEVVRLMAALGLKIGVKATPENLRYGKIMLYTDADFDGSHISSLLINFFYKFWKELFDYGMIYKAETPIIVARQKDTIVNFYKIEEYNKWESENDIKKWDISYKKGLSALKDDEYEQIISNPYLVKITIDSDSDESINTWFAKDDIYIDKRKNIIQNGI